MQKLNDDLKALLEEDRRATAEPEANTASPEPVADLSDVAKRECEIFEEGETPEGVTPEFAFDALPALSQLLKTSLFVQVSGFGA